MLVVVALVALCYCGGNYCPTVLKQNKEMLLGGAIALVLCSFFGMKLEGLVSGPGMTSEQMGDATMQREMFPVSEPLSTLPTLPSLRRGR